MARALDGAALLAYLRHLRLPADAQELVRAIRSAPPARSPQTRRGNMAVWYPSKKMGCIIKAESAKVEFAFLLEAEHDDEVLEFYDQPPAIRLEYRDRRGQLQRPWHTADYFVFRRQSAGWEECKPVEKLHRQAQARPNRYRLDDRGVWRCPPGEAYAAAFGLTYRVRSADQINWTAQSNWQFLDDYYQDLERLVVPDDLRRQWRQWVEARPGITLSELRQRVGASNADLLYTAIAQHHLYVDLARHRLAEAERTPVYRDQATAHIWERQRPVDLDLGQQESAHKTALAPSTPAHLSGTRIPDRITAEGQAVLERARPADIAIALFRDRVLHPLPGADAERAPAAVPARTKRDWARAYRQAEERFGSGFLGLLPRFTDRGGQRKIAAPVIALMHRVLEGEYDTLVRKPKRGAYGVYLLQSAAAGLPPVSQRTFYAEARRHKTVHAQALARDGRRAAYATKEPYRETVPTLPRHGLYAWSLAHLDHTELDLELYDAGTGKPLGRCWLTVLLLAQSRRLAAFSLSFDPPSYRSCMLALRLCVRRYGRLPTAITVDGGSEFRSLYFEQLLALYRIRKQQRPAAEPRFGSVGERLFGTLNTQLIHHLVGNTQAPTRPRLLAKDGGREGWTLGALAARLREWADEEYDTISHPALGQSPREAYAQSLARDGERHHRLIAYDEVFLMATLPTTRKGTALVQPGRGVRINHLDYWCEEMRDPTVERTAAPVRFDPSDLGVAYAYIHGRWRRCVSASAAFAGCTERELHLLSEAWRQRQRQQHGRAQVEATQRQLAAFRQEGARQEALWRQQRRDQGARAALAILEGGQDSIIAAAPDHMGAIGAWAEARRASASATVTAQVDAADTLVVLKRYGA